MSQSFNVFRFRNEASKVAKLLILDDPKRMLRRRASRTPENILEKVSAGEIRAVTVVVRARGQTEVAMRGEFILVIGGFKHDASKYEQFCYARSYYLEEGQVFVKQEEMGLPTNSWWSDICLTGAECLDDGGAFLASRTFDRSATTTVQIDDPPSPQPSRRGSLAGPQLSASRRGSVAGPAGDVPAPEEEHGSMYTLNQLVLVYSKSTGGWFMGEVSKVYPDGTVRVKFEGSFQKEVPLDKQEELLRPSSK